MGDNRDTENSNKAGGSPSRLQSTCMAGGSSHRPNMLPFEIFQRSACDLLTLPGMRGTGKQPAVHFPSGGDGGERVGESGEP